MDFLSFQEESFYCQHRGNRAIGIAFTFNPLFHPNRSTETCTVRGTKLVVVSAGAFGTPGILERSGIGSKDILEGIGVKQRVDLPGVGENYQGPSPRLISESKHVTEFAPRSQHLVHSVLLRRRGPDIRRNYTQ
jgi:choline dehydrogenase-like flavoprotein